MPAVIIPAHNEAAVIGRCLDALLNDPEQPPETEIIVVCNGCSDDSAQVAATRPVTVLDLETPSKALALQAGEDAATLFPRVYLDADVELAPGSLNALTSALTTGDLEAAAPRLVMDCQNASLLVRMYQAVWAELPDIKTGLAGRGAYALSTQGRSRFQDFGTMVADDLFIHSLFWPKTGQVVEGASSTVISSRTLRDLIGRKRRVFRGNAEFAAAQPAPAADPDQGRSRARDLIDLARRKPALIPALPVYVLVGLVARRLAERDLKAGSTAWGTDASSRG